MDRYELRREDYSLTTDHTDLQAAFAKLFQAHCGIDEVRAAEDTGFDEGLWKQLTATGANSMAVSEAEGGDGATLVDLTLIAEEVGRALAPVPWIDHVVSARLLARLGGLAGDEAIISGNRILAFDAAGSAGAGGKRLVSQAAIADEIIVREGDDIVRLSFSDKPARVDNLGKLPMAWVDPAAADSRTTIASGPEAVRAFELAVDEWRLLTAAALVGLLEATMRIAAEFAVNRYTLGVPIASLQGISHPLANIAITVESGRQLGRKAAWFLDNEPQARPELASAAYIYMTEEASKAAIVAVHTQGGLGVSTEAASTAYLTRARGWPLAGGDPARAAVRVAQLAAARETA